MSSPLISVIVTNYNGKDYAARCIQSVLESDYPNLEIVLVDNVSIDDSLKIIENKFGNDGHLTIIKNKTNLDFVGANNIGLRRAKGEYVVLLNNDTEVDKNWLNEILKTFQLDSKVGIVHAKLLTLKDKTKFDTCGHYMSILGLPYEVGVAEKDVGQYDRIRYIFGARGAAMAIRRSVLNKIGLLDEDFIIYGEDTDLCWRCWLSGFSVVMNPQARVYHMGAGTLNKSSYYRVYYHGTKNNIRSLIKNLSMANLLWMLPLNILCRFALALFFMLKSRFLDARWIYKGIIWNVIHFRQNMKDRFEVQHHIRRVSDASIFPFMFGNLPFPLLIKKGLSWIGRI